MAYEVRTEDGEEDLVNIVYRASEESEPFHFAVTNRALFIPRKKLIGNSAKEKVNVVLQTILDGCNKAGILTSDRRNHCHGNTKS